MFNYDLVSAQNCDSMEEWNAIIEKEFPDLNTSRVRSGSQISNRILYNLYSDKYFVPFANRSFGKFNLTLGTSKWKKLRNCRSKKKYESLEHIGWLHHFGLEPLWNQRVTERVKTKSADLNKLRIEYSDLVHKLKLGSASFDDIIKYESSAKTKFGMLMPSEIEYLLNLIIEQKTIVADRTLLSKANEYALKDVSATSLQQLYNFRTSYSMIYNRSSNMTKENVNKIINERIGSILTSIITQERIVLKQIGMDEGSFDKTASFYNDFQKSYSNFLNYPIVKELQKEIINRRTAIVSNIHPYISNRINQSTTLNELDKIELHYLKHVNQDNTIISLKKQLESKEASIKEEERKIALSLKKEEEEKNRIRKNNAVKRLLANSQKTISQIDFMAIKNDLRNNTNKIAYYSDRDIDVNRVFQEYLKNLKLNPIYIGDKLRDNSLKIIEYEAVNNNIKFRTSQGIDCYWDSTSGVVTFNKKNVVDKVVNSTAWSIAQRCTSVKKILEEVKSFKFKVVGVKLHEELGIPISWDTRLVEEICGQNAIYSDCRTPCNTWLRKGSDNFFLAVGK